MHSPNSRTGQERTERLEARITRAQKALFKQAADFQGRTLSDFIVQAVSETAIRVVKEHQVITLTTQEQAAFVEALLTPPEPGPRLRAAAGRYRKIMGQ
ncbi:MAG: DUF1778 domain-containing protein [Candidatus Tectomicrobia bacterium]|uniref:DUF1778 domain-containing protein n=1 Tax=Tectimicrobiota bacterium TaxID=2528274 RepID=A0A933GMF1_UNCTE|nr:DUF1778 domain-containing protein [Candidatus Tectomicrobia bacterium]